MYFVSVGIATSEGGDYEPLYVSITFPTGSTDGANVCASLTVNSDNLVETEECFTVVWALITSGTSLGLGWNMTTIFLNDSDGTIPYNSIANNYFLSMTSICIAAMFAVPAMAAVAESDTTLTVCVTMMTTPPTATVANQVVVTLSTVDGTGERKL